MITSVPIAATDVLASATPILEDLTISKPELTSDVTSSLIRGTSTLGAAVFVERGATFAANILAARFAGASVFGAYSIGISTANNISTYAAGGIGATATRFSGKYPYGSGNYSTFARVLGFVSLMSAVIASSILFFGAGAIAHLLHKESLTGILRWASLSAAGMLILECARGFFVGQRRLAALALLSILVGLGMVLILPFMATALQPAHMVAAHGVITLSAVILCLLLARPLSLLAPRSEVVHLAFGPMLREVWGFGFIQLSGLLSANLAGWWLTALVARGDTTLVQMGFFAIASQLRNLTGVIPSLLTEGSYATMATPDLNNEGVAQRVMALCTFASTTISLALASVGIIIAPWALRMMYGSRYEAATTAAAIGMSVAVLQMGNAPSSARVSVVSIRWVASINTVWALFTAVSGTILMLHWASAAAAMAVFFAAHVLAAGLVLSVLARRDSLPSGLVSLFALSTVSVVCLSVLALAREYLPSYEWKLTGAMILVSSLSFVGLHSLARKHSWLSALSKLAELRSRFTSLLLNRLRRRQ